MKGLIIVGSARQFSYECTGKILTTAFDNHQVECEIFDLAEKPLHQLDFSGTTQAANTIKENAKVLQEKAMAADFMILGTPTYHGSYSGILKTR